MKTDTVTKDVHVDMCQAIQEMRIESELIGERRGEQRGKQMGRLMQAREIAGNLYEMGIDIERIAQAVGYAVETVEEWLGLA